MPPVFWIGLGIAGFVFLVGVISGARSRTASLGTGAAMGAYLGVMLAFPLLAIGLDQLTSAAGSRPPVSQAPGIVGRRAGYSKGSSPDRMEQEMASTTSIPTVSLHDGVEIPQLGFGVFQVPPEETQAGRSRTALAVGYRHIDTAAAYRNERGVGAAIAASGLPRDEVFVTTKLWNSEQGYDSTLAAFEKSLERLGHGLRRPLPDPLADADRGPLPRHLARLRTDPRRRAAPARSASPTSASRTSSGSSAEAETLPTVNQIELHPRLQQAELRAWHAEHGDRHRGLEPARPGRRARRGRRS